MSVTEASMSELYFKKSYFYEGFFVVNQFKYPRNKTSKIFTMVATCPVYLEHHRFELVIDISLI